MDACPTGLRPPEPLKITSVMDSPRKCPGGRTPPSPSAPRRLHWTCRSHWGPTTEHILLGKLTLVGSTNDLNPGQFNTFKPHGNFIIRYKKQVNWAILHALGAGTMEDGCVLSTRWITLVLIHPTAWYQSPDRHYHRQPQPSVKHPEKSPGCAFYRTGTGYPRHHRQFGHICQSTARQH